MKRTIGVITVGRSDYGLYVPILKKIITAPDLDLALYVSGAHFSEKFGRTVQEIEKDGFPIAAKVPLELGDSAAEVSFAMGQCTSGFGEVFREQRPDILLVLGDRFEMHAAALAAIPFNIPIAHIHGGELTYGAIDEYFRHSLTKLSSLHFATTEVYAQRIIQMGEEPWRVTVSGAPGIDSALAMPKFSREELTTRYGIDFSQPIILSTFHSVTREVEHTEEYINNFFRALAQFPGYNVVCTYPNADTGNDIIIRKINEYARGHQHLRIVESFGHQGHLSMMQYAVAMVGNSSSGIIEAASFKLPVVNIGTRQDGRIRDKNVLDAGYSTEEIVRAIREASTAEFRDNLKDLKNPYGDGQASERIIRVLKNQPLGADLIRKKFYDKV